MGSAASLYIQSFVAGKDSVVLAGVEGRDVVVVMLCSEVAFCRLEFSRPSRDLVAAALAAARAVLPHGNSASVVRKKRSHVVEVRVIVMVFRRGFIKKGVNTFWFTVQPVLHQPVSCRAGAFCSKGSQ